MPEIFKYRMHSRVSDIRTGVKGVIICRAEYSDGQSNQYLITFTDATGRPCEWWLPEERVVPCYE